MQIETERTAFNRSATLGIRGRAVILFVLAPFETGENVLLPLCADNAFSVMPSASPVRKGGYGSVLV